MRILITCFFYIFAIIAYAVEVESSSETLNLMPADVLHSAATQYPRILETISDQRAAEARALSAEGAFDLIFDIDSYNYAEGFYDGRSVKATASRYLRSNGGARIYGGYKLSDGTFPVYEDERFTNTAGQLNIGVLFSLLRDREIDPRRFNETDKRLATREAEFEVLLTQLGVVQKAMIAYWRWVALGQKKKVYNDLLSIAEKRQIALETEVEKGARARIVLTENLQNITQRKSLVAVAQRDVATAANELSLFYRDEAGNEIIVSDENLPDYKPGISSNDTFYALENLETLYDSRPELKQLRNTITRAIRRIELNQNALLPRLDLNVEAYTPLGAIAEGGSSRDESDIIIGLKFSVPLERRLARGNLAESKAKLDALRHKENLLEDKIELEVRNVLIDLNAAENLLSLAQDEVTQSETLRNAEIRLFQRGASDFFLVNIREKTAAEAKIRFYLAGLQREIAQTNFDAATANFEKLGIN
ncbi:MAG: TolC family protein [Gammaproteobacteria bacterium]